MDADLEIHWIDGVEPVYSKVFHQFLEWIWVELDIETVNLGIVFCEEDIMKDYNHRFRQKDQVTDVLSFLNDEHPSKSRIRGDLLLCPKYIAESADDVKVDFLDELLRVTLHGNLHLLGWDHASNDAGEPMLSFQEELLGRWKRKGK